MTKNDLENSLSSSEHHPLVIEHIRVLESLRSVRVLLEQIEKLTKKKTSPTPQDMILIQTLADSALRIIKNTTE